MEKTHLFQHWYHHFVKHFLQGKQTEIIKDTTFFHFWYFFLFVFIESLLASSKNVSEHLFFLLFTVFYVLEQIAIVTNN